MIDQQVTADGKYTLDKCLGAGGQGVVYSGTKNDDGAAVAIKLLTRENEIGLKRVAREIAVARTLRSRASMKRCFVNYLDHDLSARQPYVTMSLVRGSSLRVYLDQLSNAKITDQAALEDVCRDLIMAVVEMHRCGIVHRDLKPANVLVEHLHDEPTRIVLVDFGLAIDTRDDSPPITEFGEVIGTPEYMAPELFEGTRASEQADQFSLGVILSEIIDGRVVPRMNGIAEQLDWFRDNLPLVKNPGSAIASIARRCTSYAKGERYEFTGEILDELKSVQQPTEDGRHENSPEEVFIDVSDVFFSDLASIDKYISVTSTTRQMPLRLPTDTELQMLFASSPRLVNSRELAKGADGRYYIFIPKPECKLGYEKISLWYTTFPELKVRLRRSRK